MMVPSPPVEGLSSHWAVLRALWMAERTWPWENDGKNIWDVQSDEWKWNTQHNSWDQLVLGKRTVQTKVMHKYVYTYYLTFICMLYIYIYRYTILYQSDLVDSIGNHKSLWPKPSPASWSGNSISILCTSSSRSISAICPAVGQGS